MVDVMRHRFWHIALLRTMKLHQISRVRKPKAKAAADWPPPIFNRSIEKSVAGDLRVLLGQRQLFFDVAGVQEFMTCGSTRVEPRDDRGGLGYASLSNGERNAARRLGALSIHRLHKAEGLRTVFAQNLYDLAILGVRHHEQIGSRG